MLWLWAINVLVCSRSRISIEDLFDLRGGPLAASRVAKAAVVFSTIIFVAIACRLAEAPLFGGSLRPYGEALMHPMTLHAILLGLMICPYNICCRDGRQSVFRGLRKTLVAPCHAVHFRDVIFADLLTSMSRGFTALESLYCIIQADEDTLMNSTSQHCSPVLVVGLMAVPYWWRFQQCLRKYRDGRKAFPDLVNALKYFTAFPLIFVDKLGTSMASSGLIATEDIPRLWFLCALVNSLYSFLWDITMDWGFAPEMAVALAAGIAFGLQIGYAADMGLQLGLAIGIVTGAIISYMLSNQICKCSGGRPRSKPSGDSLATDLLRDKTVFAAPFYFCAIAINLALRMLWVLRLSPLPHWFPSPAVTAIVLELLELGRRWGWIFIRLEWEMHATAIP